MCFKFLSFVYNILEFLESQNVDYNQQVQHNFSIESDTIGVYDTVTIRESKYINWNIMDKSDKLYLTILVPETFKISTKWMEIIKVVNTVVFHKEHGPFTLQKFLFCDHT